MGHIRSPQADSDLDGIWYYIASESASIEIADRLIDSITDRFFLIANYPTSVAAETTICALASGAFLWVNTSSSTVSRTKMC
jgi:plasmid stabilization system protein ParE